MMDSIAKCLYAGLGALTMTRDRAEKIFDECVERGQAAKEQRSAFVKDVLDAAEQGRKDVEKLIGEQVDRAIARMNLATRKDLDRLEEKIDRMRTPS